MTTRYTLDLADGTYPVRSSESIEGLLTEWRGRFIEAGVVAFDSNEDAEGFSAALKAKEIVEKTSRSRAPVNMQALGMLITATHAAQNAKKAKDWFTDVDMERITEFRGVEFKVNWASGVAGFTEASPFLQQAFSEYLPAIFDVARKKAEEADRAARDQILHWGPKA